jgi:hypothetical protein
MSANLMDLYLLILGLGGGLFASFVFVTVFFALLEKLHGGQFFETLIYCWNHH